jgi:hypothetical protein
MKALPFFVLWALVPALASAQHQTALDPPLVGGTLPYSISLREISLSPAPIPTLHSVAAAKWEGQWVLLAGRTAGLHGLTGQNAFDPQFENRSVWVIDPVSRQSWSKSLAETNPASGLGADVVDSLSSVNTQFHQTGDRLIVVGGYGYKRSVADHKTYDTITFIDLPGLIGWVKQAAGSDVALTWPGDVDWGYLIETSSDLQDWQQPAHPLDGIQGPMTWSHPRDLPKRFFRLLGATRSLDP